MRFPDIRPRITADCAFSLSWLDWVAFSCAVELTAPRPAVELVRLAGGIVVVFRSVLVLDDVTVVLEVVVADMVVEFTRIDTGAFDAVAFVVIVVVVPGGAIVEFTGTDTGAFDAVAFVVIVVVVLAEMLSDDPMLLADGKPDEFVCVEVVAFGVELFGCMVVVAFREAFERFGSWSRGWLIDETLANEPNRPLKNETRPLIALLIDRSIWLFAAL